MGVNMIRYSDLHTFDGVLKAMHIVGGLAVAEGGDTSCGQTGTTQRRPGTTHTAALDA
jgi:hypothetical protein